MARREFALIEAIRRRAAAGPRVRLGIGDDAAVLRWPEGRDCVVAVDMLVEDVHFTMPPAAPREIGRKALAVNLSDLAAMAARPVAAFLSLALPAQSDNALADGICAGLLDLAGEFDVSLAGGDISGSPGPLMLSVTVLGEPAGRGVVSRSGARPGDWILATGAFGGSIAGRHLTFTPRVREALKLNTLAPIHAMIDVSDGLAADLGHLLDESGVGGVLRAEKVPIHPAATGAGDRTPLERALGDGEDFELLLTLAPEDGRRLIESQPLDVPLTHIGEIVAEKGLQIVDSGGKVHDLRPIGWQHDF